jgi:argininosuccinate lyase
LAYSEKTETLMSRMSVAELEKIDSRFKEDIVASLDYEKSVKLTFAQGGTAQKCVFE